MMHRLPVTLAVTAMAGWACASGGAAGASDGAAGLSYGYMIPGSDVATALGLRAIDTIPEFPARTTLPTALVNAIQQEVAQGRWNNECTRRFSGPTVYALIFYRACDAALGPEAEPVVVVGFRPDGRVVGRVPWSGPSTVTLLVPARRF
jgi:hypothetical protein